MGIGINIVCAVILGVQNGASSAVLGSAVEIAKAVLGQ